jgi:hypothetical protein
MIMQKHYIIGLLTLLLIYPLSGFSQYSQDTAAAKENNTDRYRIRNKIDIPLALLGIAGTGYGFYLRESKPNSDSLEVLNLDPNTLPKYDRDVTMQNSATASKISDVLFAEGFVLPWFLYADKKVRHEAYDYSLMYLEAMGITGMGYSMAAGLVKKYRPYAYNQDVSLSRRLNRHSANSFYAGHVAVTATGTFFAARVYNDYHPSSSFRYVMWGLAGASTAAQGYMRYKGGFHFPEDIAVGAALGTATGILVPVLHKRAQASGGGLSMEPYFGEVPGITLRYKFKDSNSAQLAKNLSKK